MASHPIMQFYTELVDSHIPIWRRFQVMDDVKFSRLAYILMTMYEMQASHMFVFEIDRVNNIRNRPGDKKWSELVAQTFGEEGVDRLRVELPADDDFGLENELNIPSADATEERVKDSFSHVGDEGIFDYDFGDGWEIILRLEDVFVDKDIPGRELPRVVAGEGYGIIEDCGGVLGLEEVDKTFRKGSGETYESYKEWMGIEMLDLKSFDMDDINFRLKKIPRIYRDLYEYRLEPTKQSIELLTRAYMKDR